MTKIECTATKNGIARKVAYAFANAALAAQVMIRINTAPGGFELPTGERLSRAALGTFEADIAA